MLAGKQSETVLWKKKLQKRETFRENSGFVTAHMKGSREDALKNWRESGDGESVGR